MGIPAVSFVGWSGSGKTTLLVQVIAALRERGYRVGTIKHHGGDFVIDQRGKDTWRHHEAGASVVVISSPAKFALMEWPEEEYRVEAILSRITGVDIVLVEGYKRGPLPKIEVFRRANGRDPVALEDPRLIAVVSDTPLDAPVPSFGLDEAGRVAGFLEATFLEGGSR